MFVFDRIQRTNSSAFVYAVWISRDLLSFIFKGFIVLIFVRILNIDWIYVFVSQVWVVTENRRGVTFSGTGIIITLAAMWCWESNLAILQEQQLLLVLNQFYPDSAFPYMEGFHICVIQLHHFLLLILLISPISQPLLKFLTFHSSVIILCVYVHKFSNTTCWDI